MGAISQLSGNLSLNELSANGQLTVSDLYASGDWHYYYNGYPGELAQQYPLYTGYDKNGFCIDEKYIKQISEEIRKAVSVEKENEINNEPEIPKWTGFIEI